MPTPDRILKMASEIVRVEGGLVNDPDDSGGITNHGVSLKYARGIGLDNDHDGDVDGDDIRLVTPIQARDLYVRDFFEKTRVDDMPEALHPLMFDFCVNSGGPNAIAVLQQTLNLALTIAPELGFERLDEDGRQGRITLAACHAAYDAMGAHLVNAVVEERVKFLYAIAARKPSQMKYVKTRAGGKGGWITRAESFRVPA